MAYGDFGDDFGEQNNPGTQDAFGGDTSGGFGGGGFDASRGPTIGSQKNGQVVKGGSGDTTLIGSGGNLDTLGPNVDTFGSMKGVFAAPTPTITGLGSKARDELAAQSRENAIRGAAAQQQRYDSPLDIGWDQPVEKVASFVTGKTKDTSAADEEKAYGEFSQVQFNAAINKVDNPLANRSSLPPSVAYDIAVNPGSKRSSIGEKALAGLQMVAPFGTVIGLLRTAGMSRGFGVPGKPSAYNFEGGDIVQKIHKTKSKSNTTPQSNSTTLGITPAASSGPTRAQLRGWWGQGKA